MYMYSVWKGFLLSLILFLITFKLFINFLRYQWVFSEAFVVYNFVWRGLLSKFSKELKPLKLESLIQFYHAFKSCSEKSYYDLIHVTCYIEKLELDYECVCLWEWSKIWFLSFSFEHTTLWNFSICKYLHGLVV